MRKDDVLVSEFRVTAIDEGGQYVFDWVDEETGKVSFMPSESDYDDYTEEVESTLNQSGLHVVNSDDTGNPDDEDTELTDPDDERKQSKMGEVEPISPDLPDNEEFGSNETEKNTENQKDSENKDSYEEGMYQSFIVRMSDPENRRNVIETLRESGHEAAADKLDLSGPYQVTYYIKEDTIEIVGVEDMGIGSKSGEID